MYEVLNKEIRTYRNVVLILIWYEHQWFHHIHIHRQFLGHHRYEDFRYLPIMLMVIFLVFILCIFILVIIHIYRKMSNISIVNNGMIAITEGSAMGPAVKGITARKSFWCFRHTNSFAPTQFDESVKASICRRRYPCLLFFSFSCFLVNCLLTI